MPFESRSFRNDHEDEEDSIAVTSLTLTSADCDEEIDDEVNYGMQVPFLLSYYSNKKLLVDQLIEVSGNAPPLVLLSVSEFLVLC